MSYTCQWTAYDDSLWKVNISDATLECTLINFVSNGSKISFCIVDFDVEFEWHTFRAPMIIPFLIANKFSSKNSTNMMPGGSVLVISLVPRPLPWGRGYAYYMLLQKVVFMLSGRQTCLLVLAKMMTINSLSHKLHVGCRWETVINKLGPNACSGVFICACVNVCV